MAKRSSGGKASFPRLISDAIVWKRRDCDAPPQGCSHWSLRRVGTSPHKPEAAGRSARKSFPHISCPMLHLASTDMVTDKGPSTTRGELVGTPRLENGRGTQNLHGGNGSVVVSLTPRRQAIPPKPRHRYAAGDQARQTQLRWSCSQNAVRRCGEPSSAFAPPRMVATHPNRRQSAAVKWSKTTSSPIQRTAALGSLTGGALRSCDGRKIGRGDGGLDAGSAGPPVLEKPQLEALRC